MVIAAASGVGAIALVYAGVSGDWHETQWKWAAPIGLAALCIVAMTADEGIRASLSEAARKQRHGSALAEVAEQQPMAPNKDEGTI